MLRVSSPLFDESFQRESSDDSHFVDDLSMDDSPPTTPELLYSKTKREVTNIFWDPVEEHHYYVYCDESDTENE